MDKPLHSIDYDLVPPGEWISPELFDGIPFQKSEILTTQIYLSGLSNNHEREGVNSKTQQTTADSFPHATSSPTNSSLQLRSLRRSVRTDAKEFRSSFQELVSTRDVLAMSGTRACRREDRQNYSFRLRDLTSRLSRALRHLFR